MKNVMMVLFMVSAFTTLSAQVTIDSTGGTRSYTEVVSVDSTSKSELYVRANKWFAKNYGSSKEVIQMNNAEAGSLVGQGIMEIGTLIPSIMGPLYMSQKYNYAISVTTKDGKYRCEISHLSKGSVLVSLDIEGTKKALANDKFMTNKGKKEHIKILRDLIQAIDKHVMGTFESLRTDMKTAIKW